jgi:hypothetical protein
MSMPNVQPSVDLYNRVRAAFILRDSNLSSWCKAEGIHQTNAKACLVGMWGGPKGSALRARIIKASGMVIPSSSESENHSSPTQPATTGAPEFFYWGC